jgi:hypothetical protein
MSTAECDLRHSGIVKLELHVQGDVHPVARIGNGYLVLHEPQELPLCDATIFVCIDGTCKQHQVILRHRRADEPQDRIYFW